MSEQFFIVEPDPNDLFGVLIRLRPDAPQAIPAEQAKLVASVQSTLTTLRLWHRTTKDDSAAKDYANRIVKLTQVGLVGPPPRPDFANALLAELQNEVVERETGRIKDSYLKGLLAWSAGFVVVLLSFAGIARHWISSSDSDLHWVTSLGLMNVGCIVGVWLSFAARRITLTFEDLGKPQADRLSHPMRLLLFCLLVTVLGTAIWSDLVKIELVGFNLSSAKQSGMAAWLLGIFGGLAEYGLAAFIGRRSDSLKK